MSWLESRSNRAAVRSAAIRSWPPPRNATQSSEDAMVELLQNHLIVLFLKTYGVLFLLGPIVLRATFRFRAKLDPQLVPKESLPPAVQGFMMTRSAGITGLGFEPVG